MGKPDYKKIYQDLLEIKYPELKDECSIILEKNELQILDVLKLNKIIFGRGNKGNNDLKSYDKSAIKGILDYQKKNNLNNVQLADHFEISRNTISRWKKIMKKNNSK